MRVREIIIILVVTFMVLYLNTPERRMRRALNRYIKDFAVNYYRLQELLDKKYDMKQILQHFGVRPDEVDVIRFDFGKIDYLEYANTTEMRQCFLLSGEYIIQLAQVMEERFSINIDYNSNENLMIAMEILKDVRRKTLMLNEDASVVLTNMKTK